MRIHAYIFPTPPPSVWPHKRETRVCETDIYIHINTRAYIHSYTLIHAHIYTSVYRHIHAHIIHTRAYMLTFTHTTAICVAAQEGNAGVYTYTHTYIMYTCTYMHTYTFTYLHKCAHIHL